MGQQQSKDEILFQQVNYANIEGIKALHNEGAGLEWIDREGKTPLIVACMNPELINVAKTLIELGADVNAYRPGSHAGTPLHHAAKRGLDQTVKLLLSHGANVFVVNDDCDTPLDVARAKGFSNVVRTIESHICLFSGWLRELHGPGFLEALASQWLSRKIWVVVIPCGSRDYMKPAKLDLAIYSSPQDARPSVVIALPKAKVEEPKFHQPDPVLVLIDKATKKYKFASANEGDKQQLKGFLDACRGIPQVRHPPPPDNVAPQVVSATAPSATTEDVDLAMALSASIQSAHSNLSSGSSNTAGWGNSTDNPGNNGWGSSVAVSSPVPPSKASSSGWIDKPPKDSYNGWGASSSVAGSSPLPPSKASSTGWLDKPPENSHNGWGESSSPTGSSHLPPSKANSSGWLDKPPEDSQNGWSASEGGSSSSSKPISENLPSVVPMSTEIPETIPSAPPIPEGADDGPIHYPSIDISPIDVPTKYSTENKPAITGAGKEEVVDSASCVICLDAPVEGACIPCGHMAGCMSCLNGIKAKKWGCPVCRAEINQIVRIYAV